MEPYPAPLLSLHRLTDTTQMLLNNGLLNIRMDGQRYGRKKTLPLPTNSHLLLNFTKVSRTNQLHISRINLPLKVQILQFRHQDLLHASVQLEMHQGAYQRVKRIFLEDSGGTCLKHDKDSIYEIILFHPVDYLKVGVILLELSFC